MNKIDQRNFFFLFVFSMTLVFDVEWNAVCVSGTFS